MMASLLVAAYAGVATLVATITATFWSSIRNKEQDNADVYNALDHRALNLPLDAGGGQPKTEWMNMGWWTTVDGEGRLPGQNLTSKPFPQACEDLARCLYGSAGLQPSVKPADLAILDVGHGYGESLLFLIDCYKPSILHGITYSPREAARARERVAQAKTEMADLRISVGDATEALSSQTDARYDYIFALDCAYHFPSMRAFLEVAHSKLNPGGTLALFDLFTDEAYAEADDAPWFQADLQTPVPAARSTWARVFNGILLFMLSKSSPAITLLPFTEYHQLAYETFGSSASVRIRDVTSHVFPGFSDFLKRFGGSKNGDRGMRLGMTLFSKLLGRWAAGGEGGFVRCGIVVIKKNEEGAQAIDVERY